MMYAVSLVDITRPENIIMAQILIGPVRGEVFDAEPGQWAAAAIKLDCDEERAKAIIGVIRQKKRKHELRCYESKTGNSWKRI